MRVQEDKSVWLLSAGSLPCCSPVLLEQLHSLVLLWVSLHVALQTVHVGGGEVAAAAPVADHSGHIKTVLKAGNRKTTSPYSLTTE